MRPSLLLLLVLLFLQLPVFAQSQLEMNEQAGMAFVKADDKLNQVYQTIMKKYRTEPATITNIKADQIAWLKYRDAHLKAIFPSKKPGDYGSVYPMCRDQELTAMTIARTRELEKWLTTEEGDVCCGSCIPIEKP